MNIWHMQLQRVILSPMQELRRYCLDCVCAWSEEMNADAFPERGKLRTEISKLQMIVKCTKIYWSGSQTSLSELNLTFRSTHGCHWDGYGSENSSQSAAAVAKLWCLSLLYSIQIIFLAILYDSKLTFDECRWLDLLTRKHVSATHFSPIIKLH